MNNLIKLLFLFAIVPFRLPGQEIPDAFMEWKNQPNQEFTLDEQFDLSSLVYLDNCSYVGVFGANRYKINMRFDSVYKKSDNQYSIKGKSILKGKICSFKGEMNLEKIELNRCYETELYLVAIGNYSFQETCNKGGVFYGVFRLYFHYNLVTKELNDDGNTEEYNYSRGFVGNWVDSLSQNYFPCHFGLMRYTMKIGGDFDDGGGEPIINPKYKKYGWESHFDLEHNSVGFFSPVDCDNKWWLEEKIK